MKKTRFWSIFWGMMFIGAAALIILQLFGQLGDINIWTLVICIPIGIGIIACALNRVWFGMFILLGALAMIYREPIQEALGIEYALSTVLLVVAFLGIGFHILFRQNKLWKGHNEFKWDGTPTVENVDGEKVYFEEKYTGSSKYINSENLSYVGISNSFGGMQVYFTNATLAPGGATVEIDNSFGGLELYIPQGWNVINNVSNFLAGTEAHQSHRQPETDAPTLTLRGTNKFGGVDVKYV